MQDFSLHTMMFIYNTDISALFKPLQATVQVGKKVLEPFLTVNQLQCNIPATMGLMLANSWFVSLVLQKGLLFPFRIFHAQRLASAPRLLVLMQPKKDDRYSINSLGMVGGVFVVTRKCSKSD